jgi:pyruvate,orthophosphate dikinase
MIDSIRIRASYPNYFMVNLYAREGREIFNHDSEDPENRLEGNKPGTVIYRLKGDSTLREFPPRWYDMYCLLKLRDTDQKDFLTLLLLERDNLLSDEQKQHLALIRDNFHRQCCEFVNRNPLFECDELITTLTENTDFTDEAISYKGHMLLDLTKNCYPVPDFCILTAKSFQHPEHLEEMLDKAISNLETMTNCQLGDDHNPLVFAIRCAMPQYIPGLMPTLLNIGVTRKAYEAFKQSFEPSMANRVYLSTLHTLCEMMCLEHRDEHSDIELTIPAQQQRIKELENKITAQDDGIRLISDARYQAYRLTLFVRRFYEENSDLILTFMQGKQAFPSLILQRMVWTIGNNESYPGVLYSRHSRTGEGKQIESYSNIFGEEIMTGDVTTEDRAYLDRNEIRNQFPAVYHFDPLLKKLESRYKTPVTIEFAVETRPHKLSLFSVLQLNASEMTGRAALISAIDMRNEGLVSDANVMDLIKPYHLRQIISASIDDHSTAKLQFFGNGLSVLPRTAISARLCFSVAKAKELKSKGENVCLCQEHFVPQDTITLNEVEAILSMMPAAIHVVTACRGYGIPAFMDLHSYGIHIENDSIVNSEGQSIREGEMVTVSSKRQSLYKGQAAFRPARFTKYIEGGKVELEADERQFFDRMKEAYQQYQTIVTSQEAAYITDIHKLARLIRCNLQNKPKIATEIVNNWYEGHPDDYVSQVLLSRMGDHNDQSRLFNMLQNSNKIDFFRRAYQQCRSRNISGLTAGSFMLGRFVARPLPRKMWDTLSNALVAFLMNEYVLYEKYQQVLQEVGEIKLARAHSRIETEGIDNMVVRNFDLNNFAPLLFSNHDWGQVAAELENMEHQDNTHLLIEMLSRPVDEIFDLKTPWKAKIIEDILKQADN